MFEIWVYSPRVEGVHLRFGKVARGGLRWSDRREDFRTEVLGWSRRRWSRTPSSCRPAPRAASSPSNCPTRPDRDAWLAEGKGGYQMVHLRPARPHRQPGRPARSSRLSTSCGTTPTTPTSSWPPTRARRRSRTSPTPRRRNTASGSTTPSPPVARSAMTTRAWASPLVGRGSRSSGTSARWARHPDEDFTCVGIGDMSGDVFGNGMLLSEHIRLVAAFDHRHIFIDPTPDSATSFVERQRLFELPRSSWADYDRSLISAGGGVFERSAKSVAITPRWRRSALPIDTTTMTPAELMKAVLLAKVDLLWNGGIGTYVKSSGEANAEVGDRANDAIRVNGGQLRCPGRRRGRQPRLHPAGSHRGRPTRGADQHRRHRQLGRRRHQRPRGQHQDPARPTSCGTAT
jgi:glutamate dehydrogenase